jgi:hypothetical protein
MELKIIDASFHRNGIGGVGFYAIIFDDKEEGRMVASLFDEPGYCAIYSIKLLGDNNIAFAQGNSWRGDRYEEALRPLLKKWQEKNGGNRMGPFGFAQPKSKDASNGK